jgi:hypothetical protein
LSTKRKHLQRGKDTKVKETRVVRPKGRPGNRDEVQAIAVCKELQAWLKRPGNWYISKFCVESNITKEELYRFSDRFPKCKRLIELAKQAQEVKLVESGFENKNAMTTAHRIFALKNVCGWRDKTEEPFVGNLQINSFIPRPPVAPGKESTGDNKHVLAEPKTDARP